MILTAATIKMLRLVELYIANGYPNLKMVGELIYKCVCGKVNKQRIPISDMFGIICVYEVYMVGLYFNNFM